MSKNDRLAFEEFVKQQQQLQVRVTAARSLKKRKNQLLKVKFILPCVRGKKKPLIPLPGEYPCDKCNEAKFNQLCHHIHNCLCYAYWGITRVDKLEDNECYAFLATGTATNQKKTSSASSAEQKCRSPRKTS